MKTRITLHRLASYSGLLGLLLLSPLAAQNVGIGIATPAAKLEVYDHDPANTAIGGRIRISADGAPGRETYLDFAPWRGRPGGPAAQIRGIDDGAFSAHLTFWTAPPGNLGNNTTVERMRITADGNVGIATTTPTHKLHIYSSTAGAIRIEDGTQGSGKVLKSDADGVGRWAYEVPPGGIIMYSGPWNFDATGLGTGSLTGWALCNGNNGTPDLSDRFVMGTTSSATLGQTGGSNTIYLTVDQLPPHTHSISAAGDHTHGVRAIFHGQDSEGDDNCSTPYSERRVFLGDDNIWPSCGNPFRDTYPTDPAGAHDHGGATGATGQGAGIDIRPAYIRLAFIMKL